MDKIITKSLDKDGNEILVVETVQKQTHAFNRDVLPELYQQRDTFKAQLDDVSDLIERIETLKKKEVKDV